jgi:hypothetical protein
MITAIQFLYQYQSCRFFPVVTDRYPSGNAGKPQVYVFSPASGTHEKARSVRGVILMVHGMTMYGHDDPRYISLCKSLAGCG